LPRPLWPFIHILEFIFIHLYCASLVAAAAVAVSNRAAAAALPGGRGWLPRLGEARRPYSPGGPMLEHGELKSYHI
jgi:hypothetical protein